MSNKKQVVEDLLQRPYEPPKLFIFEEVEIGSGYHTLNVHYTGPERDWSKPYKKSSHVEYRNRIVAVPYPPPPSLDVSEDDIELILEALNGHAEDAEGVLRGQPNWGDKFIAMYKKRIEDCKALRKRLLEK